ncbi:MAG: integration host factor subunit beta, partial [Phycisphaerales bacterium]|nr:integration host factor subunit beta [Phycisphaerales bacterium]
MATTTKKEIIDRIAQSTQMHRDQVRLVVKEFLEQLVNEIGEGNRLEFREFGVFEVKERPARRAQNPRTLEKVPVPAKRVVKFKVGRL